jgi:4a-hydroxytetrahydrobiopterin dehydratase
MAKLNEEEIDEGLAGLRGWSKGDNCIEKRYQFKNFMRAMFFVNAVAYLAESINHHPDILIHYNEVTLRNWTHVANAVTERDFALARKIDALMNEG